MDFKSIFAILAVTLLFVAQFNIFILSILSAKGTNIKMFQMNGGQRVKKK